MNITISKHRLSMMLLMTALAVGLLATTGCDKSDGSASKAGAASDDSAKAGAEEVVGPEGPSSIDDGGITEIPNDPALAAKGKDLFDTKGCGGCHKMDTKLVGPALAGVTDLRKPQWLARWIMHPEKMIEKDPIAKKLLAEYFTPMSNMNVTPDEARALLAYLATHKKK